MDGALSGIDPGAGRATAAPACTPAVATGAEAEARAVCSASLVAAGMASTTARKGVGCDAASRRTIATAAARSACVPARVVISFSVPQLTARERERGKGIYEI